jgi:hypothetical protein
MDEGKGLESDGQRWKQTDTHHHSIVTCIVSSHCDDLQHLAVSKDS